MIFSFRMTPYFPKTHFWVLYTTRLNLRITLAGSCAADCSQGLEKSPRKLWVYFRGSRVTQTQLWFTGHRRVPTFDIYQNYYLNDLGRSRPPNRNCSCSNICNFWLRQYFSKRFLPTSRKFPGAFIDMTSKMYRYYFVLFRLVFCTVKSWHASLSSKSLLGVNHAGPPKVRSEFARRFLQPMGAVPSNCLPLSICWFPQKGSIRFSSTKS